MYYKMDDSEEQACLSARSSSHIVDRRFKHATQIWCEKHNETEQDVTVVFVPLDKRPQALI